MKLISQDVRENIVRLIKMGWPIPLISSELNIPKQTIFNISKKAGVHSAYKGGKVPGENSALSKERASAFMLRRISRGRSSVLDNGVLDEELPSADMDEIRAITEGKS